MGDFSDLLEAGDEHLRNLNTQISVIRSNSKPGLADKDAVKAANSEASKLLREVDRGLAQLGGLARNAAPSQRRPMLESIEKLKIGVAKARQELTRANDEITRGELLSGSRSPAERAETDARDKMIRTTESATRGTAKLEQARAVLHETEDIGVNVIDTMQQQREALVRTRDKASEVNTLTDTARTIVRGIQRRAITNKFILSFAILVLLGLIGVVVYFGYIKNPS